jgi:hypothetical protein
MHPIDQELNLMIRGRFDEAWKISEELEKTEPNNLRHVFNRGWFLINQGKFQEGFQALEAGRFLNVYGSRKIPTDKPIWKKQDLTDKIVIIALEAGYGDQIIFARFATEIKNLGGKCILCCDKSLHAMFSRIEGVEKCITLNEVRETYHDYWIPGFSCSWLFGHTFETLPNKPYLSANPLSVPLWKTMLNSKKIKIGIRWSGNPKFEHQQFRIFPPEPLINFHKYDELQLYSLQRDSDLRELPESISDLQHLLLSWEDTAAAIENLDLVITSCTGIAHLASAMGKPTWVIVPILPYHVWAYGEDHSPWYQNTTKIYRQKKFGDWTETFEKLENDLIEKFDLKRKD